MSIILLRPHHMMCMHFYRGLGYSKDFTANMDAVIANLKTDPDAKVRLVCGPDSICSHCPNMNADGLCSSQDKVDIMDAAALKAFGFTTETVSFATLQEQFNKKYSKETFEKVCSKCEWFLKGVCMN